MLIISSSTPRLYAFSLAMSLHILERSSTIAVDEDEVFRKTPDFTSAAARVINTVFNSLYHTPYLPYHARPNCSPVSIQILLTTYIIIAIPIRFSVASLCSFCCQTLLWRSAVKARMETVPQAPPSLSAFANQGADIIQQDLAVTPQIFDDTAIRTGGALDQAYEIDQTVDHIVSRRYRIVSTVPFSMQSVRLIIINHPLTWTDCPAVP